MVLFDKKLVAATLHNGKLYSAGNSSSNKYMDNVPTKLLIEVADGSMSFGIRSLSLFSRCDKVVIDWGDGNEEAFEFGESDKVVDISHAYSESGLYVVQISNTISLLQVTLIDSDENSSSALLKVLLFGTNINELGESCFEGAVNLDEVRFECSRIATFADYAFCNTGLTAVCIPSTVRKIGAEAFSDCKNLKNVTVDGNNLSEVGNDCFKGDYNLVLLELPAHIKSYVVCPFGDSAAVTPAYMEREIKHSLDLDVPEGWTDVPDSAFAGMQLLSACTIPSTVNLIHEGAFKDLDKTVQVEEAGTMKDYSPLFNGLQQLTFAGNTNALHNFNSTMRKTFSETCSIDDVADKCYNDEVKDVVAAHISPSVEISFTEDSNKYSYWKGVCSNKMYGEVLSALTKYTDFSNEANLSCLYSIVRHEYSEGESTLWGDIEQFNGTSFNVYHVDDDSELNSNAFTLSDLQYEPLPTVIYYTDPDSPTHETKTLYVNNKKVFTADDLNDLQQHITEIQFGKYSTLSIADRALNGCVNLTKVLIPATVTYIGKLAFANLANLKDVIFKRSRSVFVDEYAFANTTSLSSFTSEYDNINVDGIEYMQLAEGSSLGAFSNSKLSSCIRFADASSVNSTFPRSSVLQASYPKATSFDAVDRSFYIARNLELIAVPEIESFDVANVFYGRTSIDKTLSIDMHERQNNEVPSLNSEFLRTSTNSKLTNFKAVVPFDMYGDWCAHEDWKQYSGTFIVSYDNSKAVDGYVAQEYCSHLSDFLLTSTIAYGFIRVNSSMLNSNTDKILQIKLKTAPTGDMPSFDNFKLVAYSSTTGNVLGESYSVKYNGEHDRIITFKFEKPIPVNGEREIIFYLKNGDGDAMLRIYTVNIDGVYRPALDVKAADSPRIENPTAELFLQYAYDNTTVILTKGILDGTDIWMIDGKIFEPKYGRIVNDNGATRIIFLYVRGLITPFSIDNKTVIMFTDGSLVFINVADRHLTREMIAAAIPAGKHIRSIKVGNNVQSIEENVFLSLADIYKVILPSTFAKLDDPYAFAQCVNLNDVYLGESMTDVAPYVFYDCKSLRSVYLPNSISCIAPEGHQFDNSGLLEIEIPYKVADIPQHMFANCKNLTNVRLNYNVSAINDYAFYNCEKLETIDFPGSVRRLGVSVFKNCNALNAVNMQLLFNVPEITTVGKVNTVSLQTVELVNAYMPSEVALYFAPTTVADLKNAISELKVKIQLELNNYNEETATQELTDKYQADLINYNVNTANEEAISKLKDEYLLANLATFDIAYADLSLNVADVMYNNFCNAENWCDLSTHIFASPEYMNSLGRINKNIVRGEKITQAIVNGVSKPLSVDTRDNIKDVEVSAFARNATLTSVVIGPSVSAINDYAFARCSNLKKVKILAGSPLTLKPHAFDYCSELNSFEIDDSRQINGFGNGMLNMTKISSLTLPNITALGDEMLEDCFYLQQVILPDTLTSIGNKAFCNNVNLSTVVNMNDNITSIGDKAFYNCLKLNTLYMPTKLRNIGNQAFTNAGITTFDFSLFDHIPTLANSNAFKTLTNEYKIIVAEDMYDSWIAADLWNNISSNITSLITGKPQTSETA